MANLRESLLMLCLNAGEPMSQADLACEMGLSPREIMTMLSTLEREGSIKAIVKNKQIFYEIL